MDCNEAQDTESDNTNDTSYRWRSSIPEDEASAASTDKNDEQWMSDFADDKFKILDPDDPLMKRFQDALKIHLTRLDNKLTDEINQLEMAIKDNNKLRETEGVTLFGIQQEAAEQSAAIENYKHILTDVINLRGDTEERLKVIKDNNRKVNGELEAVKTKEKDILQSIESLDVLQEQFSKWESELAGNVTISQRISEKDAAKERELLYQKQQKDYVLYKLEDEIVRLQGDIRDLEEKLQMKDDEKVSLGQAIADANADLQGLEKERKTLYNAWNNALHLISQRDKIHEEIVSEQKKIEDSLDNLQKQINKVKKDSLKEMERNEYLTTVEAKLTEDIDNLKNFRTADKNKFLNLEDNFVKITNFIKQNEKEIDNVTSEYKSVIHEENCLNKEMQKINGVKRKLEDDVLIKLDDKACHDNTVRQLNKLWYETKDSNVEVELNLARLENSYGKQLFELEKLNSTVENEKFDLDARIKSNIEKDGKNNKLRNEIRNYDVLYSQKERKIAVINKKIDELLTLARREEANPLNLRLIGVEKSLDELKEKIKKAQQYWLRQQGYMFTLSEQRSEQMKELNTLNKEITLMEYKNIKLEDELSKQQKEETNINRTINALQYKLLQINLRLASQKELKHELEDKNNAAKTEYVNALKDAEMELIKMQANIKKLKEEKVTLKDELKATQQESLSWEKKLQLVNEINKSCKEKRSEGGDIAMMKSEIHKMELRLSYLQKAQEKLVQDMESCVTKRDNIMDEAFAREKRNPKNQHNQRIILKKRLEDQKTKIKNMSKEIKQIECKIRNIEDEQKKLVEYLSEGQKLLRQNEDVLPDLEKKMLEAEMIKHNNLEVLVRKQRKVNMFRDVKNGKYKLLIKNQGALDEAWERQQQINCQLKSVMKQTEHDFPLLHNEIQRILLTLHVS